MSRTENFVVPDDPGGERLVFMRTHVVDRIEVAGNSEKGDTVAINIEPPAEVSRRQVPHFAEFHNLCFSRLSIGIWF